MIVRDNRVEVVMQEPVHLLGVLGEPVLSHVVLVSSLEPTQTVPAAGKLIHSRPDLSMTH